MAQNLQQEGSFFSTVAGVGECGLGLRMLGKPPSGDGISV